MTKGRDLTIIFAFYRNRDMLIQQCRRFRELPDELKAHLRLIVTDDGSEILQEDETELPPLARGALHEDIGFPFELYRLKVNIRWNQDACRNLAIHHATTDWLLISDMDHIPPEVTLRHLIFGKFSPEHVYNFERSTLEASGEVTPYKPHPNSWFMTREAYWKIGGFDERLAGLYGTDADFKERVRAQFGEPVRIGHPLLRVPRDTIQDASTSSLKRKDGNDGDTLKELRRNRNATPGWQPLHFTFPWERVA